MPSAAAEDFASSAMLQMLGAGLRAQGIDMTPVAPRNARIARMQKVELLANAVTRHGGRVLLRLDAGLDSLAGQAIPEALLAGRGPWDLLSRWGRLERYVHGRHRTRRTPVSAGEMGMQACLVEHHALDGRTPHALESLAVMAVMAALLRRGGAQALQARFDEVDLFGPEGETRIDVLLAAGVCPQWTFAWKDDPACPIRSREVPAAFDHAPQTVRAVARLIVADLLQRWQLDAVAAALGRSARGLQRDLAADGWRFTDIVARARQCEAARLLRETASPLAEIGYLCGYADQAHFNRQFEQRVGVPPGQYRRAFAPDATQG